MKNFEIIKVENGYLVRPIATNHTDRYQVPMYVFSTEDQLADWIRTQLAEATK